jgi:flagellin-like protein
MWTEKARSWRKKGKRGVSPIIATILLVAITVVLAAVLYILISGLTRGPGNQPLGTALAIGTANEASVGTTYWYNFTIESAGAGITWSSVQLTVTGSGGSVVALGAPAAGTIWAVYPITGATSATGAGGLVTATTPQETGWTNGVGSGATGISSTQTLVIRTTTNLAGTGAELNALGTGSFAGTIHANIP